MKRCVIGAAALVLFGCSSFPDADRTARSEPNPYCAEIARLRAQDAYYNGFGTDIQQRIRSEAYDSCITSKATLIEQPQRR